MAKKQLDQDQSNSDKRKSIRDTLDKTVIAIPLLEDLNEEKGRLEADPSLEPEPFAVIIDLNLKIPRRQGWCTNLGLQRQLTK